MLLTETFNPPSVNAVQRRVIQNRKNMAVIFPTGVLWMIQTDTIFIDIIGIPGCYILFINTVD